MRSDVRPPPNIMPMPATGRPKMMSAPRRFPGMSGYRRRRAPGPAAGARHRSGIAPIALCEGEALASFEPVEAWALECRAVALVEIVEPYDPVTPTQ